jgi:8-oxo-dGTP diphosphatase
MERPLVGVSVAIRRGKKVLMGLRKKGHAGGMWGFPGGHMEGGEFFDQCGIREVEEETGIILPCAKFWTVVNTIFHAEEKHYVVVLLVADMPEGQEARITEPDKCDRLEWFCWDSLPSPLMQGIGKLVSGGLNPFEVQP